MFRVAYICIFVLLCIQFLTRAESSIEPKKALAMDQRCNLSVVNATDTSKLEVLSSEIRETPTLYTDEYFSQAVDNFFKQGFINLLIRIPLICFAFFLLFCFLFILVNSIIYEGFRNDMYRIFKGEVIELDD